MFSGTNKHDCYGRGAQCLEEAGKGSLAVLVRRTLPNAGMKRVSGSSSLFSVHTYCVPAHRWTTLLTALIRHPGKSKLLVCMGTGSPLHRGDKTSLVHAASQNRGEEELLSLSTLV